MPYCPGAGVRGSSVAGMKPARVVLVVLDAFPNDRVSADLTPTLWALAEEGGRNADGGLADLTAATYPNHLSFVSGAPAKEHGWFANRAFVDGGWAQTAQLGPPVPTIFDACATEGRSSVAVLGDQYLVGVCGAGVADQHWPPGGELPEAAPTNPGGYAADEAVVSAASGMDLDADFVFVQLDSVDAARHRFGATSDEALEQCRATDAALGEILETIRPRWGDTVVCVVSDHDQEDVSQQDPIDLREHLRDGLTHTNQGTAAVVVGQTDDAELLAIPGVTGSVAMRPDHHVVWGDDGQLFAREARVKGDHGSPRTRAQVAIVAGGHPRVAGIAEGIERTRPTSASWLAPLCEVMDLRWRPGVELSR